MVEREQFRHMQNASYQCCQPYSTPSVSADRTSNVIRAELHLGQSATSTAMSRLTIAARRGQCAKDRLQPGRAAVTYWRSIDNDTALVAREASVHGGFGT